jgi:hypothetical protein
MIKRLTSPASFCLVWCLLFLFPAWSLAGSVMITKGSTLKEGSLEVLMTLPTGLVLSRMEIDVASWVVNFGSQDFVVYDPAMGVCSRYEEALIMTLPGPNEKLTSVDGRMGTLSEFLEDKPYVVYDTDLRMIEVMSIVSAPSLSTPPDTMITGGPSGTITKKDVTFTFIGSDNTTSTSNLVYAYFLDGYDQSWSGYSGATSKTYANLPNGSYTFYVRSKDEAQNVDLSPASQSFTVDYTYADHGDVNRDGKVDLLDAILAIRICIGMTPAEEVNTDTDVDGDGKIGMAEVIYILQKAAGLR